MKANSQSNEVNKLIAENPSLSYTELSRLIKLQLGIDMKEEAVRGRHRRLRSFGSETPQAEEKPEDQLQIDKQIQRHKKVKVETDKKYKALLEENENLEKQLEIALGTKDFKAELVPEVVSSTHSEATAFIIASDWHLEEQVLSVKVNGRNEFNLDVAKHRAQEFFQASVKLLKKEQRAQKIDTLVLCLLGDFISSNIHEELLENCLLRPIEAIMFAEELIAGGIEYLLKNTDVSIVIPCHVGNHTRITHKVHISTEQGNSLETIMFHHLRRYFAHSKRVQFRIAESYHSYIEVYNYTVRLHHGHSIKYGGGVGGLTIPVNKAIAQWQKIRPADLDVFGHFHQMFDGGNFICNGSIIGFNAFAIAIKGSYEPPKQVFFLVDKKRGKTVVAPICFTR
jgi:hypothetical protein